MPLDADEVAELTDAAAAGPESASVDGRSAKNYSLRDRIALEQHRANQETTTAGVSNFGLRFTQLVPPGCG